MEKSGLQDYSINPPSFSLTQSMGKSGLQDYSINPPSLLSLTQDPAMAAVSPTKFAPADWHLSNFVISSSAERQRGATHDVRQQSQKLRNETGERGKQLSFLLCSWG